MKSTLYVYCAISLQLAVCSLFIQDHCMQLAVCSLFARALQLAIGSDVKVESAIYAWENAL